MDAHRQPRLTLRGSHINKIVFSRFDPAIDGYALWVAQATGLGQRRVTAGPAYFPAWSPDHSRLIFDFPDASGSEQVGRINADGTRFEALTEVPGVSEAVGHSPDGRHIFFDLFSPDQAEFCTSIWVMQSDGDGPHPLFGRNSRTFHVEPEYSPYGSKIAFGRIAPTKDPQEGALFVANSDG